jgi:hypothetical protein
MKRLDLAYGVPDVRFFCWARCEWNSPGTHDVRAAGGSDSADMDLHELSSKMTTSSILRKLEGGDRRSIGRSNEVVAEVLGNRKLFGALFVGLSVDDPVVRARAADAVEKISTVHPEYLHPYKAQLLGELACCWQKEVRWHVAQILPRLRWNAQERQQVYDTLTGYLCDSSSIVKTFAMQGLADLTTQAPELRPAVLRQLQKLTVSGTPAMRARGRKLLVVLSGSTRCSSRGTRG